MVEQDVSLLAEQYSFVHQVARDIQDRKKLGIERYGQALKPFDGRDTYVDLYQELLDALKYMRKAIYEDYGTKWHQTKVVTKTKPDRARLLAMYKQLMEMCMELTEYAHMGDSS
jgi:predicted CoA-binding protein